MFYQSNINKKLNRGQKYFFEILITYVPETGNP